MKIGLFLHPFERSGLSGVVDGLRLAAAAGLHSAWVSEVYGLDALTALAAAGREAPGLGEVGTAVVPLYPRHPIVLAGQALTAQAALEGRLTLGVGPSHRVIVEDVLGYSFHRPLRHVREYLTVLRALVDEGVADYRGETLQVATRLGPLRVRDAAAVPILLAALAPGMVQLAGELADGTVTWLAGPAVLRQRIVPSLQATARAAGRAVPRVVAGLPVCVTGNQALARERVARTLKPYGVLPSYRRVLDEEGAAGPACVAVVGDEHRVERQLEHLAEAGVTDFIGYVVGSAPDRETTVRVLGDLALDRGPGIATT